MFQVLGTAKTLRNKCYNFNRRGARLQTDFQCRRSDSRDHSLQFSASSALKRCWADVRHLVPGQLLNKKQRLTKQRLCVCVCLCACVIVRPNKQTDTHIYMNIYVHMLAHIFDAAFTMYLQSRQLWRRKRNTKWQKVNKVSKFERNSSNFTNVVPGCFGTIFLAVSCEMETKRWVRPFWRHCHMLCLHSGSSLCHCRSLCGLLRDSWRCCWFCWVNWARAKALKDRNVMFTLCTEWTNNNGSVLREQRRLNQCYTWTKKIGTNSNNFWCSGKITLHQLPELVQPLKTKCVPL